MFNIDFMISYHNLAFGNTAAASIVKSKSEELKISKEDEAEARNRYKALQDRFEAATRELSQERDELSMKLHNSSSAITSLADALDIPQVSYSSSVGFVVHWMVLS